MVLGHTVHPMGLVISSHVDPSISILRHLPSEDLQLDVVHEREHDSFFCRSSMMLLGLASMGAIVEKVCMHKDLGVKNFSWRHHDVISRKR